MTRMDAARERGADMLKRRALQAARREGLSTSPATQEDLELDRIAAKAAGIHLHHWNADLQRWMTSSVELGDPDGSWNPRDDDEDAWRLACDLSLFDGLEKKTSDIAALFRFDIWPRAAARRAAWLAAADIGRRMQDAAPEVQS